MQTFFVNAKLFDEKVRVSSTVGRYLHTFRQVPLLSKQGFWEYLSRENMQLLKVLPFLAERVNLECDSAVLSGIFVCLDFIASQ